MDKNSKASPPQVFKRFFQWYCDPKLYDFLEGDLLEVYHRRLKSVGRGKADILFIVDVILLFRPGIIKPITPNPQTNNGLMIKNYFMIGWRNLSRNKSYALINIGGLSLSMTCAILIFSFVKYHLSYDDFHEHSDRIYRMVTELHRDVTSYRNNVPPALGEAFRNDYTFGEKVARIYTQHDLLITLKKEDEVIKFQETGGVAFTEPAYFDIFNFPLLRGEKHSVLAEPNTAIITEKTALKYFGDEDPIGKVLWLANKFPLEVTGLLKDFPENTDLHTAIFISYPTLKTYDPFLANESNGWSGLWEGMQAYTLLQPNVLPDQVESIMPAYVKKHRPTSKNVHHYKLLPLKEMHFDARYRGPMEKRNLWILSIVGLFLVATACVNFINLATAQSLKRSKEVGVRKVLGSQKKQLFWQFMSETAIITAMGIAFALLFSYALLPYMNRFFQVQMEVNPFTDHLLIRFLIALLTTVTFLAGYYPALVLARFQPVAALKGKLTQQNVGGFNTRRLLIVSQFAISQVLIIGVIVIINQIRFANDSNLGFDKEAVVMINAGTDSLATTKQTLKNEITKIAGVDNVSLCFTAPSSDSDWGNSIKFNNSSEEVNFRTSIKSADADYASLFELEFIAGRNMSPSDTVREMLVNETMVQKLELSSAEEAIGNTIVADGGQMKGTIVGVIKDFHDKSFHEEISAILITTFANDYQYFAVKLNMSKAKSVLSEIEKMWSVQHPDQIFQFEFLDDSIAKFYKNEQTMLTLIQAFSFISIFIGCLGLYGLVSFMVVQRSKEIGIRKVLGSDVNQILWIFWKEFAQLVLIAFAIAAPIAWWAMHRWLQGFRFQITISIWVFVTAVVASLVIALITVGYKVMGAALRNPVRSLRQE